MMEIINGNVAVIRDGDYVQYVIYRKFYHSTRRFFEEIRYYLEEHKLEEPNVGYMKIASDRFLPITDGKFKDEFRLLAEEFGVQSPCYCKTCGGAQFIYIEDETTYCPTCKKKC